MKNLKLLAALALASAAFAVSAQNIATVNGKPIPKSLQDEWVAQLIANGGKDTPEARRQITENLVANALVEQEAAKRKISDDPKVKFALDYAQIPYSSGSSPERRNGQTSGQRQRNQGSL